MPSAFSASFAAVFAESLLTGLLVAGSSAGLSILFGLIIFRKVKHSLKCTLLEFFAILGPRAKSTLGRKKSSLGLAGAACLLFGSTIFGVSVCSFLAGESPLAFLGAPIELAFALQITLFLLALYFTGAFVVMLFESCLRPFANLEAWLVETAYRENCSTRLVELRVAEESHQIGLAAAPPSENFSAETRARRNRL